MADDALLDFNGNSGPIVWIVRLTY